jgi:hypothetical protein
MKRHQGKRVALEEETVPRRRDSIRPVGPEEAIEEKVLRRMASFGGEGPEEKE